MSWRRLALTLRAQMLESIDSGDASVQGGAGGLYRNDRRFLGFVRRSASRSHPICICL